MGCKRIPYTNTSNTIIMSKLDRAEKKARIEKVKPSELLKKDTDAVMKFFRLDSNATSAQFIQAEKNLFVGQQASRADFFDALPHKMPKEIYLAVMQEITKQTFEERSAKYSKGYLSDVPGSVE